MRKERKRKKEEPSMLLQVHTCIGSKILFEIIKYVPKTKINIWKCKVKDAPNTKPSVLYSVRFSVQYIIFDLESATSDYG